MVAWTQEGFGVVCRPKHAPFDRAHVFESFHASLYFADTERRRLEKNEGLAENFDIVVVRAQVSYEYDPSVASLRYEG